MLLGEKPSSCPVATDEDVNRDTMVLFSRGLGKNSKDTAQGLKPSYFEETKSGRDRREGWWERNNKRMSGVLQGKQAIRRS